MWKVFPIFFILLAGAVGSAVLIAPVTDSFAQPAGRGGNDPGNDPDDPGRDPCVGPNCVPPPGWPPGHDCLSGGLDCGSDVLAALRQCLCGSEQSVQEPSCGNFQLTKAATAEYCGQQ